MDAVADFSPDMLVPVAVAESTAPELVELEASAKTSFCAFDIADGLYFSPKYFI